MARLTARRRIWTGIGIITAITAITAGAWGLRQWAPFDHGSSAIVWPSNVRPLAEFVESETQLHFQRAVTVRYVHDAAEFHALLAPPPRSADAQATLVADAALGRALGFWSGTVDLAADGDLLRGASEFGSAYLHTTDTILVAAKDAHVSLTPLQRADLVLTLAQALDEQQFHVADRVAAAPSAQAAEAIVGVDLGQAIWLHDRYVHRFNTAERNAFDFATRAQSATFAAKVGRVPPAFRALRIQAQRLGPAFVTALHQIGNGAIVAAFTAQAPTALDQLEMPTAKYASRDHAEPVDPPPVPKGATLISHRELGPFGVYLLLASGLPATEALTASDGWGNDALTVFRTGSQVCANGRIVGDSSADADRIERALNAWGHARPKEAGVLVGRRGATLLFSACDPGTGVSESAIDQAAVNQFFSRADVLQQQINATGQAQRSECVAVSAFARYLARDLRGGNPTVDSTAILDQIGADCDASV